MINIISQIDLQWDMARHLRQVLQLLANTVSLIDQVISLQNSNYCQNLFIINRYKYSKIKYKQGEVK